MNDYEDVLKAAREDPEVVGLLLVGSRGRGFETACSDHDLTMIARDDAAPAVRARYGTRRLSGVDLVVHSLSEFRGYAAWESDDAWDRYDFAHVKIHVDKTGDIAPIVAEKGRIPPEKQGSYVERRIDEYVNGVFRSMKCLRNGNRFGAHLEASHSVPVLLDLLFALEGRHRPFLGCVERELLAYPLRFLPWPVSRFLETLRAVLSSADREAQQELLRGVESLCRRLGYGEVFDAWEGKDRWAMSWEGP